MPSAALASSKGRPRLLGSGNTYRPLGGTELDRRTEIAVTLGLAALALAAVVRSPSGTQGRVVRPTAGSAGASSPADDRKSDLPDEATLAEWYSIGHLIGPESAPIRIVEFGTFTCSFCRTFAASIDTIQRRYPGLVSVRWMHYSLPDSVKSGSTDFLAEASECMPGRSEFEQFYRVVLLEGRPLDSRGALLVAAPTLGVRDPLRLMACLDAESSRTRLDQHTRATAWIGPVGTPAWYLNGRLFVGAVSTFQLDSLVRRELRGD